MTTQKFGGTWTQEKLNVFTEYLDAYLPKIAVLYPEKSRPIYAVFRLKSESNQPQVVEISTSRQKKNLRFLGGFWWMISREPQPLALRWRSCSRASLASDFP